MAAAQLVCGMCEMKGVRFDRLLSILRSEVKQRRKMRYALQREFCEGLVGNIAASCRRIDSVVEMLVDAPVPRRRPRVRCVVDSGAAAK